MMGLFTLKIKKVNLVVGWKMCILVYQAGDLRPRFFNLGKLKYEYGFRT
jgi:hypothetical protein